MAGDAPSPDLGLPGARTTRRGFFRLVGAGAAFTALGTLRALPAPGASESGGDAARFFDPRETEILTQIVERMVDTGEPDAPAVRETRAVPVIDGLCAGLPPDVTAPLPTLIRFFDWSPLVFDLRFSRFTRLDASGKDDCLRSWMTSRLALRRQAFYALRNLAMLGYYSQDGTWPAIGYAGPLLSREGAARPSP